MFNHEEKYVYENYIQKLQGATVKVVPPMAIPAYSSMLPSLYTPSISAASFMEKAQEGSGSDGFDSFFEQKLELNEDKVSLLLSDMYRR